MTEQPIAVVVGIGPGNGSSFVRKFASEGYCVVALSRSEESLTLVDSVEGAHGHVCDATDADAVREVFEHIVADHGLPDVVIYNAGSGTWGPLDEVEPSDLTASWEVNALGLFHVAKAVLPKMRERGSGALGVTGATASTRGKPFTTAFAQAKAAQRSLAQSFAREFGPAGVHVFHFVIDGVIDLPRTRERMPDKPDDFFLDPDDIAESVYRAAIQPRSAWTFEFDLRPHGESW